MNITIIFRSLLDQKLQKKVVFLGKKTDRSIVSSLNQVQWYAWYQNSGSTRHRWILSIGRTESL